nr:unnamed protein product [Callosobruchus analis]
MYSGAEHKDVNMTKTTALVLRLLKPYLMKGHDVFMDNYYNSVELSEKLLNLRTHTNGTLRSNRRGNPKQLVKKKLKKGEHFWLGKKYVYISKWKDKRDVLMITTRNHPQLITSKIGSEKRNLEFFYLYRKYCKENSKKYTFMQFRDSLITALLKLPENAEGIHMVRKSKNDCRRFESQQSMSTEGSAIPEKNEDSNGPKRAVGSNEKATHGYEYWEQKKVNRWFCNQPLSPVQNDDPPQVHVLQNIIVVPGHSKQDGGDESSSAPEGSFSDFNVYTPEETSATKNDAKHEESMEVATDVGHHSDEALAAPKDRPIDDDSYSLENNIDRDPSVRDLRELGDRMEDTTFHSSDESPVQEMNPVEKPINVFKYQIFIKRASLPRKFTLQKLWNPTKYLYTLYIVKDDLTPVLTFLKDYGQPKSTYAFYFEDNDGDIIYNKLSTLVSTVFRHSTFKLIKCNRKLENVTEVLRQAEIMTYNYETKTNHRGITETINQIKNKILLASN